MVTPGQGLPCLLVDQKSEFFAQAPVVGEDQGGAVPADGAKKIPGQDLPYRPARRIALGQGRTGHPYPVGPGFRGSEHPDRPGRVDGIRGIVAMHGKPPHKGGHGFRIGHGGGQGYPLEFS